MNTKLKISDHFQASHSMTLGNYPAKAKHCNWGMIHSQCSKSLRFRCREPWLLGPHPISHTPSCKNYSQCKESFASSPHSGPAPQRARGFYECMQMKQHCLPLKDVIEKTRRACCKRGAALVSLIFFKEHTDMPWTLWGQRWDITTSVYLHFQLLQSSHQNTKMIPRNRHKDGINGEATSNSAYLWLVFLIPSSVKPR